MTSPDLPDWTPPNVGEILAQFESSDERLMRPELLDQYLESSNHAALRSLFASMYRARNRAEHLSNALVAYIHAQLRKEPRVIEYFDKQLDDYNAEGRAIRAERVEAGRKIKKQNAGGASTSRPRAKRSSAEPAEPMEW